MTSQDSCPTPEDVAQALIDVGRPAILQFTSPDSCILSTKVALQVFEHFGYRARPLRVMCAVMNEAMWEGLEAGVITMEKTMEEQADRWPPGAYGVGVGFDMPDGRRGRHLAAVVEDRLLLDLSLDQASRPEHDLVVKCMAFKADEPFLMGVSWSVFTVEGAVLAYRADPGSEPFWTRSPNWGRRDDSLRRMLAGHVIRSLQVPFSVLEHGPRPV